MMNENSQCMIDAIPEKRPAAPRWGGCKHLAMSIC